jgi:hypothetical protein
MSGIRETAVCYTEPAGCGYRAQIVAAASRAPTFSAKVCRLGLARVRSEPDSEPDSESGSESDIVDTRRQPAIHEQRMVPPDLAVFVISRFTTNNNAKEALRFFDGQSIVPTDYEVWFKDYPVLLDAFKKHVEAAGVANGDD